MGLDLGDRNSWYCVVDEAGQIQLEQRVRTSAKALREVFGAMPRSRIALETGTHSPWISRLLSELGHEVIVANARKVRLIGESCKKDDRLDAQTLARLARIDPELLCPVKHRSRQAQADLALIRARAGLVRARTALVNNGPRTGQARGNRVFKEWARSWARRTIIQSAIRLIAPRHPHREDDTKSCFTSRLESCAFGVRGGGLCNRRARTA